MKIAVSHWEGRISPVFDVAQELLLVELEAGRILNRKYVLLGSSNPFARTEQMVALGIRLLICGAVSKEHENVLGREGIQVIAFTCGRVEGVLDALICDRLDDRRFRMPGFTEPETPSPGHSGKGQGRGRRRRKTHMHSKRLRPG